MKAIMYGAGNIGRGFIGQLLSYSGYEVVFIDIDDTLIDGINEKKRYPVKVVSNAKTYEEWVENVRAVNGKDVNKAAGEIADSDIIATAVGANILKWIAPVLAEGLKLRFEAGLPPVNIIICENLLDSSSVLKGLIKKHLPENMHSMLDSRVGFVEASVGRMVPVMTEEMKGGDPLRIWVEPYNSLPVDKDAFVGEIPKLNNLKPFSPFSFYIKRKLFIHNLGHAACAYLGKAKGYEYIWQAVGDEEIKRAAKKAMTQAAQALSKKYGVSESELSEHIDDLLFRFANKALSDSVARVGRDPLRKLSPNDRIAGAIAFCRSVGMPYDGILAIVAAATAFYDESDESSIKMAAMIKEQGKTGFLKEWCELSEEDADKA